MGLGLSKPYPMQAIGPLARGFGRSTQPSPTTTRAASAPPPPPPPPRAAFTAFYAPSRIIDRSQLTIVDSIAGEKAKQFSEERGDLVNENVATEFYDDQIMRGPGNGVPKFVETAPVTPPIDGKKLLASLVAAYFLFS